MGSKASITLGEDPFLTIDKKPILNESLLDPFHGLVGQLIEIKRLLRLGAEVKSFECSRLLRQIKRLLTNIFNDFPIIKKKTQLESLSFEDIGILLESIIPEINELIALKKPKK